MTAPTLTDDLRALATVDAPYPPPLLGDRRAAFVEQANTALADDVMRANIERCVAEIDDAEVRKMLEVRLRRIRRTLYRARKPMDPERVEALIEEIAEIQDKLQRL